MNRHVANTLLVTHDKGPAGRHSRAGVANGLCCATGSLMLVALMGCTGDTLHLGVNEAPVVVATILPAIDHSQGSGSVRQYLSTSFQPADWQFRFFQRHRDTSRLRDLGPTHVLVQVMDGGAIPWKKSSSPQEPGDWDFSKLNEIILPLLDLGADPELQIAVAPRIGGMVDSSGNFSSTDENNQLFAQYCENLVRYYNGDGFDWGGAHLVAPSPRRPIKWWGILSDANVRGMTQEDYVAVYNLVAERMTEVDPAIRLSALELSDSASPFPGTWFQYFAERVSDPNRVHAIAWHIYGTVHRDTKDKDIFDRIATSADNLRSIRRDLALLPDVPIRVTQNNVNGDAPDANGNSSADPKTRFQQDDRGTSTFFAAYRPYLYSQLAKAGGQALYHWQYTAGTCEVEDGFCTKSDTGLDTSHQNSEVDYVTGKPYLSYWVDYWLHRTFPFTDESPADDLLQVELSDERAEVEVLATRRLADGSVAVMVVDHAVAFPDDDETHPADRNGKGLPRDVVLDTASFASEGALPWVSLKIIDKNSDQDSLDSEPDDIRVAPNQKTVIPLAGYGVGFARFHR